MYSLLTAKSDTLNGSITSGASSATLTTGNFGSPTGTQLLVLDYDNGSLEVISCTIAGTALTAITRGLDGTTGVAHSNGAKVLMDLVPSHYTQLGAIAASDAWTSWTPTWTGGVSNPALGNGTITGSYIKYGRIVHAQLGLTMGSTTTFGSGDFRFTFPVAPIATTGFTGTVLGIDTSAGTYYTGAILSATSYMVIISHAGTLAWQSTTPFIWATGDEIHLSLTYQSLA